MWRRRPPTALDFDTTYEAFKYQSYQYILFGLGFRPDMRGNESAYPFTAEAEHEFTRVQRASLRSLGLRRIGQVALKPDRPEFRGMIQVVRHLITVEEVD